MTNILNEARYETVIIIPLSNISIHLLALTTYDIMMMSLLTHLSLGSYADVTLYGLAGSPALCPAHWLLNAEVSESILSKHTASIQVSGQEPTLPRQSLGTGNGGMTVWRHGSMGMGERQYRSMKYLFGSEAVHVGGLQEVIEVLLKL